MRTVTILAALVLGSSVLNVPESSAGCGKCGSGLNCIQWNYRLCTVWCSYTCWCETTYSDCAFTLKALGPDGGILVRGDRLPNRRIDEDGDIRWVTCDGTIVARGYAMSTRERVYEQTSTVVI
jgi:hypothetical protein